MFGAPKLPLGGGGLASLAPSRFFRFRAPSVPYGPARTERNMFDHMMLGRMARPLPQGLAGLGMRGYR